MNQRKKSEVRSEKKEIQHVNICGIQSRTMAKVTALNTCIEKTNGLKSIASASNLKEERKKNHYTYIRISRF